MEIRLNGLPLDIGEPAANWPGTLREVAKAVAWAAMERAIEQGERNNATIEVWDGSGRLLVAVSASIQASWPRWNGHWDGQRDGMQEPGADTAEDGPRA